jgi:hypothetical protein
MNKLLPALMAMMIVIGIIPFASASTETGTGPNRIVQLEDADWYTNTSVSFPEIVCNATANSYAFVFVDESGLNATLNYTVNMTVENNGTYYNKTFNVTVPTNGTVTGYVNYTADELPIGEFNVNMTLIWDLGWIEQNWWNGTFETVDVVDYNLQVTTPQMIMSLIGVAVVILLIGKFIGTIGKQIKKE